MDKTKNICKEIEEVYSVFKEGFPEFDKMSKNTFYNVMHLWTSLSILYLYCIDRDIGEEVCISIISEIEKSFDKLRGKGDDQTVELKDYIDSYMDAATGDKDDKNESFHIHVEHIFIKKDLQSYSDTVAKCLYNVLVGYAYHVHSIDELNEENYKEMIPFSANGFIEKMHSVFVSFSMINGDFKVDEAVAVEMIINLLKKKMCRTGFRYDIDGELYPEVILNELDLYSSPMDIEDDEDEDEEDDDEDEEIEDDEEEEEEDEEEDEDYDFEDDEFDEEAEEQRKELESLMNELDGLIGLEEIKKDVKSIVSFIRVCNARREAGLMVPPISYHLVFMGDPGTGKTTVARLIARIYKCLGILRKGQLVEAQRSTLVAGYLGQTAIKTEKVINEALGGVLFIDEAYSLVKENDQYGEECIETLLKEMDDHREDLIVIVAGYSDLMRDFINSNPGLKSRFNKYFNFSDYSGQELYDIFVKFYTENDYNIRSDELKKYILRKFEKYAVAHDDNFGNARFVRNIFERAISAQAVRLTERADDIDLDSPSGADKLRLKELTKSDIDWAFKEM